MERLLESVFCPRPLKVSVFAPVSEVASPVQGLPMHTTEFGSRAPDLCVNVYVCTCVRVPGKTASRAFFNSGESDLVLRKSLPTGGRKIMSVVCNSGDI